MKRYIVVLFSVLLLMSLICSQAYAQNYFYFSNGKKIELTLSEQEITVKFKPDVTTHEIQMIVSSEPALGEYSQLLTSLDKDIYKLTLKTKTNVEELIARLRNYAKVGNANPVYLFKNEMKLRVTDRFVVQFQPAVTKTEIDALNGQHHIEVIESDKGFPNRYILRVTNASDLSVLSMANLYYGKSNVVYSLPDFLTEINLWNLPNDTYFSKQYYLRNYGQTGGVSGADINVAPAWDITTGSSSITVAIIDEGGSAQEDLPSIRIVPGYDYYQDDSDPSAGGNEAHGMACGGIIAATQDNNKGISGITPDSKIMFLRIFGPYGGKEGDVASNTHIADSYDFAWQHGADILSSSWGFNTQGFWDDDIAAAINRALTMGRGDGDLVAEPEDKGCVVVFAAGNTANRGSNNYGFISFPANVPGVIVVGATDKSNEIQWYSPRGTGTQLSIVAPSGNLGFPLPDGSVNLNGDVWSIDIPGQPGWNDGTYGTTNPHTHYILYTWAPPGGDSYPPGNYTSHFGGTSAACPQVSGVAALLLSVNPDLKQSQVKTIIENTANDMGTTGYDTDFGYGRIDAYQALLLALAYDNKSASSQSTSFNGQRKLYRETSGKLHEVFSSGAIDQGEIFYRNSTNNGVSWDITKRLSDGTATNLAPCITMGPSSTVIVVWQKKNGSNYNVVFSRSTNGGSTWSSISTLQSNFSCASPGPLPSVSANGNTGDVIVVYRSSSGLRYVKSTSNMSSWNSPSTISGSNGNYNSPSVSFYPISSPPLDKCNLAFSTYAGYSSKLYYNYYSFLTSSWSSSSNLSSMLPGTYTEHKNPSLVNSSNSSSTIHVAWESTLMAPPTPVLIHRKGSSGNFGSQYNVIQYQSANNPSITGLSSDNAWMVFQNSTSGGFSKVKYYNNGGSWIWGSPSYVSSGNYAQISVGSSNAKYLWTSGSISPYSINIGSETLSKSEPLSFDYSRELNFIDIKTGSSISLEIKQPQIVHKDGTISLLQFVNPPPDSIVININEILKYGDTQSIALPTDIDTLKIQYRIRTIKSTDLIQEANASLFFNIYDDNKEDVLNTVVNRTIVRGSDTTYNLLQVNVPASSISNLTDDSRISIQPTITGLVNGSAEMIASLGHIYRLNAEGTSELTKNVFEKTNSSQEYFLEQNYPNPFNPVTQIRYSIIEDVFVSVKVYDVLGREITTLINEKKQAGTYSVNFDASNLASGIYFYTLRAGSIVRTNKMILLR